MREHEGGTLLKRQGVQGRVELAEYFRFRGSTLGRPQIDDVRQFGARDRPPAGEFVAAAVAGDGEQPGRERRPLWVERCQAAERCQEHLLGDSLLVGVARRQVADQCQQRALVAIHEAAERLDVVRQHLPNRVEVIVHGALPCRTGLLLRGYTAGPEKSSQPRGASRSGSEQSVPPPYLASRSARLRIESFGSRRTLYALVSNGTTTLSGLPRRMAAANRAATSTQRIFV